MLFEDSSKKTGSGSPRWYHTSRFPLRVSLAANSWYSFLFAGPHNLLHGYTHRSPPVPARKEIFELLSVKNIRRDTESSSRTAFANGCSRFSGSS